MGSETTRAGSLRPLCHSLPQSTEPSWPDGLGEFSSGRTPGGLCEVTGSLEAEKTPPLPLRSGQLWWPVVQWSMPRPYSCSGTQTNSGHRPGGGRKSRGGWVLSIPSDAQRRPGRSWAWTWGSGQSGAGQVRLAASQCTVTQPGGGPSFSWPHTILGTIRDSDPGPSREQWSP